MTRRRASRSAWRSPDHPLIFEINALPWLDHLTRRGDRRVDLGSVPGEHWDAIAAAGFDAVWIMGVWARSPGGVALALADQSARASFDAALPDWDTDDVVGSPYCIRDYVVDDSLGGPDGLAVAREELARRGIGLLLDFVPNHVAPDHPWATSHPDRFVRGTTHDLARDPASFVEVGGEVLARGRDPYFAPWPDVVQLNAFSPDLRAAAVDTLQRIAEQCDGVRCDMAMLMMNDVFERTWGARGGPRPRTEYWIEAIAAVRERHRDFLFIAEAYWDLEWQLQQQGFDHCYDKRLYDRLLQGRPEEVRLHLCADDGYQAGLLRFLENHDEPRAAAILEPARQKALTVATWTQQGARLVHHGEAEGWRVRLPVFLGRFPEEETDDELAAFHESLSSALRDPTFHDGRWRLCEVTGWEADDSAENLLAWTWTGEGRWLVVVNLSDGWASGLVRTSWDDLRSQTCQLVDVTAGTTIERTGVDLCDGMFVRLGPWAWHLFRVEPTETAA